MGFHCFAAMVDVHIYSQTTFSYLGMMTMLNRNSLVFPNTFPYCHTSYVQSKKLQSRYMSKETGWDKVLQCETKVVSGK
jgi:hypothetical protein